MGHAIPISLSPLDEAVHGLKVGDKVFLSWRDEVHDGGVVTALEDGRLWVDGREVEPDTLVANLTRQGLEHVLGPKSEDFEARADHYSQTSAERQAAYRQGFEAGEHRLAEYIAGRIDAALSQSRDRAATCRDLVLEIEALCQRIMRPF